MSEHFVVLSMPAERTLPPFEAEDGIQLLYDDPLTGERRGGLQGFVGEAPIDGVPTAVACIDVSEDVLQRGIDEGRWLYVGPREVDDGPER